MILSRVQSGHIGIRDNDFRSTYRSIEAAAMDAGAIPVHLWTQSTVAMLERAAIDAYQLRDRCRLRMAHRPQTPMRQLVAERNLVDCVLRHLRSILSRYNARLHRLRQNQNQ